MASSADRHENTDLLTRITREAGALGRSATQLPGFLVDTATATAQDGFDALTDLLGARSASHNAARMEQSAQRLDQAGQNVNQSQQPQPPSPSQAQTSGPSLDFAEALTSTSQRAIELGGDVLSAAGSAASQATEPFLAGMEWLSGDLRVDAETGERVGWFDEPESGDAERVGPGFEARRMVATGLLAPQLAQSSNADFSIMDTETWNLAHDLSGGDFGEDLTIGQSMFHLMRGTDVLDPDQVAEHADTPLFDVATGTVDALVRMTADPDVLLARGARSLRSNFLKPQVKSSIARTEQLDDLFRTRRYKQRDRWMETLPDDEDLAMRRIKESVFPNDSRGWGKARRLAEAPDAQSRQQVWRNLYGDGDSLSSLQQMHGRGRRRTDALTELQNLAPTPLRKRFLGQGESTSDRLAAIQSRLEKDTVEDSAVFSHLSPDAASDARFDWRNDPNRGDLLQAEINDTMRSTSRIETLRSLHQSEDELPSALWSLRPAQPGRLERTLNSQTYQKSAWTKPVRMLTEPPRTKRPHRIIDVDDDSAPEQLDRLFAQGPFSTDDATRNRMVGRMADEIDPQQRIQIWDEANDTIMRRIIADTNRRHGTRLSQGEADEILSNARRGQQRARDHVRKQYSAGNRDLFPVEDETGIHNVTMPLFRSQSPNTVFAPDFDQIAKTLDRKAGKGLLPGSGEIVEAGADVMDSINYYWKAQVLLRGAWPVRVTAFDEAWRPLIKYGASSALPEVAKGARNYARSMARDLGFDNPARAGRVGAATGGIGGLVSGALPRALAGEPLAALAESIPQAAIGAGAGTVGFRLLGNLATMERSGMNWSRMRKLDIAPPFGEPGDRANLFYDRASSRRSMTRFLREDRELESIADETARNPRAWETITPDDVRHMEDWETHINSVIRGDPMAERILAGSSRDEMVGWLDSHEGRRYVRGMRAHEEVQNPELLVDQAMDEVHGLFPGNQGRQLADIALERPVAQSDLTSLYPDAATRPNVLGEGLSGALQGNLFTRKLHEGIDRWMNRLGTMPTDNLVRHPTFEVAYRRYFERWLDSNRPEWRHTGTHAVHMDPEEITTLQDSARRQALQEVRDISYDLAERSQLHHLLRHVHPFLPAVQEAVSTHLNLAARNPLPYTRAAKTWFAADRIEDISYRDPEDGSQWLVFQVPESAKDIASHVTPLSRAVDGEGKVRIPKNAFNMVLQAPFGVGPYVQASVSEVLKRKPGAADDLKPLMDVFMPYGPSSNVSDAFLGSTAGRAQSLLSTWLGDEQSDREYYSYWTRNLGMALADMEEGRREQVDWNDPEQVETLMTDIDTKTNATFATRAIAGFFSPVQPVYESPYWMHEQALRQEMEREEQLPDDERAQLISEHGTAVERFMDAYGDEMAYVLGSMTESNNGVPPTAEAFERGEQFDSLIQRHPEYGSFIVGRSTNPSQVEFSRSVMDHQMGQPVSPGSEEMQRELLAPEQIAESGEETIAWKEWTGFLDYIDAERISRGLPSLDVAEARDLAALKERKRDQLAAQYPAWAESREEEVTLPRRKWTERIAAFREFTETPGLADRPDVKATSQYLSLRDEMVRRLAQRAASGGARTIDAASNQDLQQTWNAAVADLVERNVAFGPVYHRWFEHDVPSAADVNNIPGERERPLDVTDQALQQLDETEAAP